MVIDMQKDRCKAFMLHIRMYTKVSHKYLWKDMSEFKSKVKNHDLNLTVWLKNQNKAVNETFYGNIIVLCLSIYRQEVCYLNISFPQ